MLILTRRRDESLIINGNIEVRVLDVRGQQVRIGIIAPPEIKVVRKEIMSSAGDSAEEGSAGAPPAESS
ncbi:MAG: carbon storage regulator [Gammaproteobacteria bacterium]|nr:carbon storage regulator [Gammaproteobacteria bacterium]MDD9823921.1 carbon storage regulator [Gammaproteobacteria bacterium]MDD9863086.1 carbon storage regulator [Gammaproteobacteria bacterium]